MREPLRKVHEGIQSLLAGITIADMCEKEEELTPACAPPQARCITANLRFYEAAHLSR